MANKKISELPDATAVTSADLLPIVDVVVGETKKATFEQVAELSATLSGGTQTSIPMAISASTDLGVYVVLGAYSINPQNFNSMEFVTIASVTNAAITGNIQLWNVTDAAEVAVNNYPGTLTPTYSASAVALPASTKIYEIRHRVTGGTAPADRINTSWAGLVALAKPNILI